MSRGTANPLRNLHCVDRGIDRLDLVCAVTAWIGVKGWTPSFKEEIAAS